MHAVLVRVEVEGQRGHVLLEEKRKSCNPHVVLVKKKRKSEKKVLNWNVR